MRAQLMTMKMFLCLLHLLALGALLQPAECSPVFTARVAPGNGTSLAQALQNSSITHIVIVPDTLDLAAGLEGLPPKFLVNRNITVTGARGTQTVLDQRFQRARLQLCGSCTWTYRNITVANDSRDSAAGNELFVAAQLGAKVVLQDANVLRLACASPADSLAVLAITPPSAAFAGGRAAQQQRHSTRDVTIQGTTYPDALFADSFSTDVAPSQEGRSATGGYALQWKNTGRPCLHYVPTSCLDTKSMDACTKDLTDALLAANAPSSSHPSSPLPPGALAAAVTVPVVAVLGAAAGLGVWLCRRRKRAPHSPKTFSCRKRELPHDDDYYDDITDVETGSKANTEPSDSGGPMRADAQPLRRPLGLQAGWCVAKACTTPYLGPVDDDRIEFGELIGSGSFGRVYQAKWAGRDVAVKVIEHNTDTTVPVEREVTLMLSFNHPNVVRAYHFVTRVHTSEVMPHAASKDHELTKGSSAGSRTPNSSCTPTQRPPPTRPDVGNMSLAAAAGNPHAAAAIAANSAAAWRSIGSSGDAAAAGKAGSTAATAGSSKSSSSGGKEKEIRALPPHPHSKAAAAAAAGGNGSNAGHTNGSGNSRSSLGGSDKPSPGGSAISTPQLQLVQRLPSLTAGTPRLVHKVETWLVQEYCDCGTLASVASEWKHEPESDQKMLERLQLLKDCAQGLKELHSRNVVHGDLNARNVLLSSSGVTALGVVAKLADLGLSRIVRSHKSHHSTNTVGTMSHVAPELLRYGHMSTAGDIYAFGIMMWELYTGQAAFRKLHVGQFFEAIVVRNLRPMIPRGMAADYQLLMQSCWSASPTDRPSCDRLLNCIKLMIEVRQDRLIYPIGPPTSTAAAAAAAAATGPPPLYLQHHGPASGPGTFAGGYSAPLPAVDAAAASDAAAVRMTRTPRHQPLPALPQQQQLPELPELPQQGQTLAAGATAASSAAAAAGDSPKAFQAVQFSARSTTSAPGAAAEGAAAVSALPALLAMLKQGARQNQQALLLEMAGGRLHSSCPSDSRAPRSNRSLDVSGLGMSEGLPRLTPINTGRRSSAESMGSTYQLPVGHSQSDPLPGHGALTHSMQQQILMQLQEQAQRSSGSFHGFPEASAGSGGSSGIPTPLLRYSHLSGSSAGRTMVTPLTGVKYQYPHSSGGSGSSKTAPLPGLTGVAPSGGSSSSGPLWVPGTSNLARSGSLGTSSRHWYWQRSAAPTNEDETAEGGDGDDDDIRSVTDQDEPAEKLVDDQRGCPDVMAKLQSDNNWYI